MHDTSTIGDSAELLFNATKFTLTFMKYSNRGSIDVYVDGVKITTITANSGSLLWQQTYTSPALDAGNHTLRFVHAGGESYIDIDAIQIYGAPMAVSVGTYDDTHSAWQYSGAWTPYTGSGPANNTIHYTGTVSNYAELLFNGTRFTLTFTKSSNRGLIDVGYELESLNPNDFDGNSRPQGKGFDIGAYEFLEP